MRNSTRLILLATPLALAACDSGEQTSDAPETPMAAQDMPMNEDMPMMQSGDAAETASGEGTVTAVDAEAGTITIDHGPIPDMNWPAMSMAFTADDASREEVAVGDDVTFEFRTTEGGGEITSIVKK